MNIAKRFLEHLLKTNYKVRKTNSLFFAITFSLFLISCGSKTEHAEEHEVLPFNTVEVNDDQYKMAGIELGQVEYKEMNNVIKVNGLVNVPPQNLVSVSANMGGYVKSTDLVQGSPVTKGQTVCVIENSEFIELQQAYLESKNSFEYAEADYNRQKDLNKENVSSAKIYQLALSEYKNLKTKVFALEQKLKLIGIDVKYLNEENIKSSVAIVSPITGYVKTVNINIGKYVNPTDVMFEIVNNQKLTLELSLFEKDIEKVSIGQKIRFSLPNKTNIEQSAEIYQVGKTISDDKTVKVYATVDNNDKNILPGMFVSALIETANDSTTALPTEAVLTFDDKNYIFIYYDKKIENGKNMTLFQLIEVKKGVTTKGFTEIILPEKFDITKSKVVIKGAYNLLSAMKNAGDMAC